MGSGSGASGSGSGSGAPDGLNATITDARAQNASFSQQAANSTQPSVERAEAAAITAVGRNNTINR